MDALLTDRERKDHSQVTFKTYCHLAYSHRRMSPLVCLCVLCDIFTTTVYLVEESNVLNGIINYLSVVNGNDNVCFCTKN